MIDLRVLGEPGQCREKAQDLRRVVPEVADTARVVRSGRSRALSSWRGGQDAWLFERQAASLAADGESLEAGLRQAARALETFADELTVVRETLTQARETALAGGLTVDGDWVLDEAVAQVMGEQVEADAARVRAEVAALAHDARVKEEAAHEALRSTLGEAVPESWAEIRVNAGGAVQVEGLAGGGYGSMSAHTGLAGGSLVSEWATRHQYGTFYPDSFGKHAGAASSRVKLLRALDEEHWQPRPGQSVPYARWVRFGKVLGVGSAVLTGGTSAYEQYQEDSMTHPEMATSEQVTRAATVGFSAGFGDALGSAAGYTAALPVVAGAPWVGVPVAVGTASAGGYAGGEGGQWLGEQVKGPLGDGVAKVTDGVQSFGDAFTFWGTEDDQ